MIFIRFLILFVLLLQTRAAAAVLEKVRTK